MNSEILLTRKRTRNDIKTRNGNIKRKNSNSKMVQFNGFNIIELIHKESNEIIDVPKITQDEEKINLEIKEPDSNLHEILESNPEIKELKRTKAKNIEEFYTSKNGISTIKENCFICLMTNFLSNELLYFNSKKDLFNYIKYCFILRNKLLIIDEDTFKENKEKFFNANSSFINGWRFYIPKTICKGCFMEIINMKNLISHIKNIFCDIEKDSLCKTNYRNYALFSPRFRVAFSLRNRLRHQRRHNRNGNRNTRSKTSQKNIKNKDSENNEYIMDIEPKEKIYNTAIELIKDKRILIIDKKILDDSVLNNLKNNSFYKNNNIQNNNLCKNINENNNKTSIPNNKNILIEKGTKKILDKKSLTNKNNFKSNFNSKEEENLNNNKNSMYPSQYNVNNLNINNKKIKKINIIHNSVKEIFNNINKIFYELFLSLDNFKKYILFLMPNFNNLNFSQMITQYKSFYPIFYEEKKNVSNYLMKFNSTSEGLNLVLNEIANNMEINEKEKNNLIITIQELNKDIDENKKILEKYDNLFNNFLNNYNHYCRILFEINEYGHNYILFQK